MRILANFDHIFAAGKVRYIYLHLLRCSADRDGKAPQPSASLLDFDAILVLFCHLYFTLCSEVWECWVGFGLGRDLGVLGRDLVVLG